MAKAAGGAPFQELHFSDERSVSRPHVSGLLQRTKLRSRQVRQLLDHVGAIARLHDAGDGDSIRGAESEHDTATIATLLRGEPAVARRSSPGSAWSWSRPSCERPVGSASRGAWPRRPPGPWPWWPRRAPAPRQYGPLGCTKRAAEGEILQNPAALAVGSVDGAIAAGVVGISESDTGAEPARLHPRPGHRCLATQRDRRTQLSQPERRVLHWASLRWNASTL